MPDDRRVLRLQQLVHETVANTIQRDLDDPRIGLITVTKVKLARDLTQCVVYWSCLDHDGPRRTAERGLADALPVIQGAVAEAMGTRLTPRLTLKFDPSMERADNIDAILAKLAQERGDPPAPETPTPPPVDADDDADEETDEDGDEDADKDAAEDDAADDAEDEPKV